jgi:hypothetical protein
MYPKMQIRYNIMSKQNKFKYIIYSMLHEWMQQLFLYLNVVFREHFISEDLQSILFLFN